MIILNIYYTGLAGKAQEFASEMLELNLVERIRQQPGNLRYDYFIPLNQAETILLIDSWENQTALDQHHQSEMMEEIIKLREKYQLTMKVERFVCEPEDIPEFDATYIQE